MGSRGSPQRPIGLCAHCLSSASLTYMSVLSYMTSRPDVPTSPCSSPPPLPQSSNRQKKKSHPLILTSTTAAQESRRHRRTPARAAPRPPRRHLHCNPQHAWPATPLPAHHACLVTTTITSPFTAIYCPSSPQLLGEACRRCIHASLTQTMAPSPRRWTNLSSSHLASDHTIADQPGTIAGGHPKPLLPMILNSTRAFPLWSSSRSSIVNAL